MDICNCFVQAAGPPDSRFLVISMAEFFLLAALFVDIIPRLSRAILKRQPYARSLLECGMYDADVIFSVFEAAVPGNIPADIWTQSCITVLQMLDSARALPLASSSSSSVVQAADQYNHYSQQQLIELLMQKDVTIDEWKHKV